ncbi:hypothetical protein AADG42_15730 [Ammonicoccus fulvus]|uniref:Uncharacterized protein n=1 Tax=Ammonicoccus fulvus TaxID=3138240 RepID=A0ABZ3FUC7_9ACTN
MTHTNAELMAHAQELADQMRELLPEPVEIAEPGLAPEPAVIAEPGTDDRSPLAL